MELGSGQARFQGISPEGLRDAHVRGPSQSRLLLQVHNSVGRLTHVKRLSRDHAHLPCCQRFVVQSSILMSRVHRRFPIPARVQRHLASEWFGHHECTATLSHFTRLWVGVQSQFTSEWLGRSVLVGGEWFRGYEVDGQAAGARCRAALVESRHGARAR